MLHLTLPCDLNAPARVREELDRLEVIDPIRMDAKLVASELVSNAVRHSACAPSDVIHVRAGLSAEFLEISVHDPGL